MKCHYDTLAVRKDASTEAIKVGLSRLVSRYIPVGQHLTNLDM
jgi:hypothetical protein